MKNNNSLDSLFCENIKYDFHVSNKSRSKYHIDESLFSITGDLIIANFHRARILASQINETRKREGNHRQLTSAGQLNALGLIHEICHFLIRIYEDIENPGVLARGIDYISQEIGSQNLDEVLLQFVKEFSPLLVYNRKATAEEYLEGYTDNKPNKEIILEELLLLHLENSNPAIVSLEELYSDKSLIDKTRYKEFITSIEQYFLREKPFGKGNLTLISFLKEPINESPHSIEGQLEFIRERWSIYIKKKFLDRLLSGRDLILEDFRLFIQHGGFDKPTPPVPVYEFDLDYLNKLKSRLAAGDKLSEIEREYYNSEIEKFTQDIDWMPKVVMIAKNSYVWLDQLSKKYKRQIVRLDQIPDEELDSLVKWNFSALWLIGIWERSSASRKIKQLTGNPEAASSAYSLFDYVIASDLGGEDSFQNLKYRAGLRGIRLASDMVPNHTGTYSKWVIEKPEYFIQTDVSPYPNYTFYSPNLSDDSRVEIRIEDKYYSREDAAVVFQRRDNLTGSVKYIYHGNDGTHMPWNDTAQLNLLNPEVRESLIQTILHVAKKFPIIRFDAAMTLSKKHYQRLWFPEPGTGGAIPSRSDYGMTRQAFDEAMPGEFWREVVDRINSEMPNTLLLAEAFWLMEGYFVRTLGMHRVYNSAFMHMLMKEENSKYRELIKNTLDFNPEILKRYVNFMSNPDEETAVNQFGKGDKYFGVVILMITLPGLPMFAHGQIEGFSEKYGMEYKKAYYDELVDENLIRRHEAEIFPLMKRRSLFSQVANFEFYDFNVDTGGVNENVFAYTNREGNERALVIYNNAYDQCSGTINHSVIKNNNSNGSNKRIVKLSEALQLKTEHPYYYSCKDHKTGLEYLLSGSEIYENGIYVSLSGYEYRALINFNEIYDITGDYAKLFQLIKGEGVFSISQRLEEMKLSPLHESLNYLLCKETFAELNIVCFEYDVAKIGYPEVKISTVLRERFNRTLTEIKTLRNITIDINEVVSGLIKDLIGINHAYSHLQNTKKQSRLIGLPLSDLILSKDNHHKEDEVLFTYFILKNTLYSVQSRNNAGLLFEELLFDKELINIFKEAGHSVDKLFEESTLIKALLTKSNLIQSKEITSKGKESTFISELINNREVYAYLMLNEFNETIYFNKERFDKLVNWIFILSIIAEESKNHIESAGSLAPKQKISRSKLKDTGVKVSNGLETALDTLQGLKDKSKESGYKLITFKELLSTKVVEKRTSIKKIATKKKQEKTAKIKKSNKKTR